MAHRPRQRVHLLENYGDWQHQEIMIQTSSVSVLKVLGEEASCSLPHVLRLFEEAVWTHFHTCLWAVIGSRRILLLCCRAQGSCNRNENSWDTFLPSQKGSRGATPPLKPSVLPQLQAELHTLQGLHSPAGLLFSNRAHGIREGTSQIRTWLFSTHTLKKKKILEYTLSNSVIFTLITEFLIVACLHRCVQVEWNQHNFWIRWGKCH